MVTLNVVTDRRLSTVWVNYTPDEIVAALSIHLGRSYDISLLTDFGEIDDIVEQLGCSGFESNHDGDYYTVRLEHTSRRPCSSFTDEQLESVRKKYPTDFALHGAGAAKDDAWYATAKSMELAILRCIVQMLENS